MYVFLLAEWLRNWGWAVTRASQRHAGETWRAGSSRAQDRGSEQPRAGDRSLGPRETGAGLRTRTTLGQGAQGIVSRQGK